VLVVAGEVIGPEVAAPGALTDDQARAPGRPHDRGRGVRRPVHIARAVVPDGRRGHPWSPTLYGAGGPDGVVLAHGAAFDKASWAPFATWLAGRGHVDFRGYGRSTAGTDSRALFEDVLGAVRYLHNHGVTRVAVFGAAWEAAPSPKPPCEPLPVRSTV
jgi:pimeloyl-ACP methyl ester carboxylesterase